MECNNSRKQKTIDAPETVLLYAFKYVLGRKTYAVSQVIEDIERNINTLSYKSLWYISDEIKKAISNDNAGMKMDVDDWLSLINKIHIENDDKYKHYELIVSISDNTIFYAIRYLMNCNKDLKEASVVAEVTNFIYDNLPFLEEKELMIIKKEINETLRDADANLTVIIRMQLMLIESTIEDMLREYPHH